MTGIIRMFFCKIAHHCLSKLVLLWLGSGLVLAGVLIVLVWCWVVHDMVLVLSMLCFDDVLAGFGLVLVWIRSGSVSM